MKAGSIAKGLLVLAALSLMTPALAHRRGGRHFHHHKRHVGAVIVVGKPKPVKKRVVVHGDVAAIVDFNVKPRATEVYVDGTLRGTADNFDGRPQKMHLRPGVHTIKLITPDGVTVEREIRLTSGTEIDLDLDLG